METATERRDNRPKWFLEGKKVEMTFLDEKFRFNWEIVIDLSSGTLIGDALSLEEDANVIVEAVKAGLYSHTPPATLLLGNRSDDLLKNVRSRLQQEGIPHPVEMATDTQEIRRYEISTALQPWESRFVSQEIKGRTKRQVAMEILRSLMGAYVTLVNQVPKKIEKRRKALPVEATVAAPISSQMGAPEQPPTETATKGKRVLIAEDSLTGLQLIESSLRQAGYETVTAKDGEEAEQKIRTEKLDAVILDVVMPKKNGFQICRELRRDPNYQYLPVIFISSKSEVSDRLWGLKQGANEYLIKPFHIRDLVATVKKYVAA
jgi:twitching motility two-component system response regulator PilH